MKRSILILCACAALAGCSDDDLVVKRPATPGDEVQFGATAYMSSGNGTRTEYGDAVGDKIELRWVEGDKLDIACPEAVAGRRKAAYEIVSTSIIADADAASADNSTATQLQKLGEYGIQWGEPGEHNFYAIYPSAESFSETERGKIGLDGEGLNGYLPVTQDPKSVTQDGNNYILNPDMRYAFMVAQNSVDSSVDGATGVSLSFTPLVTALQFELTAPLIDGGNTSGETDVTITSVSLYSSAGNSICGNFNYKFADGVLTETNEETGFNRITMTLSDEVVLKGNTGNKADVTFFLLPTADIEAGDLRLQVFYTYSGSPFVKSLRIGKDLTAKKKYFFRNAQLPAISSDVEGSSWFSALDPNVLISQLSIPVAGNAFSSYYTGTNSQYYKEQSLHYTELWNKGVRGFEFSTSLGCTRTGLGTWWNPYEYTYQGTLENEYFVCNGAEMTSATGTDGTAVTFGNAFRNLAGQLDVEGFQNECLIIICTYKTYDGDSDCGCDPQHYVEDLEAWLTANPAVNDKLELLTPTSTVGDLRGKIAIIIRPGEDAYSNQATSDVVVSNEKLTLVQNWGTCCDKWNTRFGSKYAIEGAFKDKTAAEFSVEDYLWGVSKSTSSFDGTQDFVDGYPTVNDYQFDHSTNIGGEVHLQEWSRIVPSSFSDDGKFYSGVEDHLVTSNYHYLWLNWPESYSQKQDMIKVTLDASMATMGGSEDNKIFINSLCGFYPDKNLGVSYYPYNGHYTYSRYTFDLSNAGAGGDYVTCAYDLNKWFYGWLTTENTDESGQLKQGPVGLVMLNHIGTTDGGSDDKSLDLVNWIMMNNFRFPLATDTEADASGPESGGEDADGDLEPS
ncbi:MAG: hypothetical protein ACI4B5_09120 [Bacteroidaceae bacterium]